jgi:hypothetical protein
MSWERIAWLYTIMDAEGKEKVVAAAEGISLTTYLPTADYERPERKSGLFMDLSHDGPILKPLAEVSNQQKEAE